MQSKQDSVRNVCLNEKSTLNSINSIISILLPIKLGLNTDYIRNNSQAECYLLQRSARLPCTPNNIIAHTMSSQNT